MDKLTVKELLSLKGGADGGGEPGCVELLQYEANTHEAPDTGDPETNERLEDAFWKKWDEEWFKCIGVEP